MKKILIVLLLLATSACAALQPAPDLTWDHDPEALIIRVTEGGGLQPEAAYYNELPQALVWGNGRVLWQTVDADSTRRVWEGQLSEMEMVDLLQTFADEGFFRMDDHYSPDEEVFDSSSTDLRLNLLAGSYRVSEYHSGAPSGFHKLAGLLASGAGAEGTPYLPQRGYLTAMPLDFYDGLDVSDIPVWDAAAIGLDLNDALGVWIEGEALESAWTAVNRMYWSPKVVQGDELYELYLELPELTGKEPPSENEEAIAPTPTVATTEESVEVESNDETEDVEELVEEEAVEETAVQLGGTVTATVVITASDGLPLQATYYAPVSSSLRPAVILLHMYRGKRDNWLPSGLPQRLVRDDRYHVLTLDMRGHGETGGAEDWALAEEDVRAVWRWLVDQPGVDGEKTAVVGGSIGSSMAMRGGANIGEINTVVLLSPGLDYFGVTTEDALERYGKRPLLIVASEDDSYSAESSRTLAEQAQGEVQLQMYDTAGHGIRMFNVQPELTTLIADWLAAHWQNAE